MKDGRDDVTVAVPLQAEPVAPGQLLNERRRHAVERQSQVIERHSQLPDVCAKRERSNYCVSRTRLVFAPSSSSLQTATLRNKNSLVYVE